MKRNVNRLIRINEEIKRETINIIRNEIKDPRVDKMMTIIQVDTTNDLKYCKVFISVLGNEKIKKDTLTGLKIAEGYIRKQLAKRLNLRNTPEITFELDNSIEYSFHMSELLRDINKSDKDDNDESK